MNNQTKQKLDELNELRQQNYISEEEYAAARANILLGAGFDIIPRTDSAPTPFYAPPLKEKEEKSGCGCLFVFLILLIVLVGGVFAMPDDLLKKLPGLDGILEYEQVQTARLTLHRFIDDLLGGQTQELPAPPSPDRSSTEPVIAVPEVSSEKSDLPKARSQNASENSVPTVSLSVTAEPQAPIEEEATPSPDLLQATVGSKGELPDMDMEPVKSSVWGNSVRIRSTPDRSDDSNIIGRARKGESLTILEEITNEGGMKWYRVRMDHGDREGWVSANLVRPIKQERK